jgi:hypothetical protein
MSSQHKTPLGEPGLPAFLGPDRRRVVEQTVFFLLLGQPGELGVKRMIGREECLLAMENRRIPAGGIVEAVDLAGAERELDAALERRVRVGLEIGIDEVRNLARLTVQLDQVGPIDFSQVCTGASLVNAQKRIERIERGPMDVESARQQFADGRSAAGFVDGLGAAGPEEDVIGQAARIRIAAEECADIALESDRKCRDRRAAVASVEVLDTVDASEANRRPQRSFLATLW